MDKSKIKDEVWAAVQAINRLWTVENRPDYLGNYFHERMTAIVGSELLQLEGGAACVAGWKDFSQTAKMHSWKEIDPKIEIFGDGTVAVVAYRYETSFDMSGRTMNVAGRDMMSLVKENGRWRVVADQFAPFPSS